MKRLNITFISILFFSCLSYAQLAMGKWRTHLAYNNVAQIAQSENKIYAVSDGALFSVDKLDFNTEFYSKLTGLNGSNISLIEYDPTSKQLLIIYSNGNIDMLTSGGVINIPDLYNKQLTTDKGINHVFFYQNKAYLSCSFGILVLNMHKNEIADTYFIGPNASEVKVIGTTINDGFIYAVSASAIYKASATEPNLVNFEYWSQLNNLPGSGDYQALTSFSGKLILQRAGKLYAQDALGAWNQIFPDIKATYINVTNNKLNIFDGTSAYISDQQFNLTTINNLGKITDAEYDATSSTYWFAGNDKGVIAYKDNLPSYYKPEGPAVNVPYDMTFAGKKLFVLQGGRWAGQFNNDGIVMMLENEKWTNILRNEIEGKDAIPHKVSDFMNVAVDPDDNSHFFITSFGTGLYEFKDNKYSKWYYTDNSTIQTVIPSNPYEYMRIDGAVFDKNKNLFLTNMSSNKNVEIKYKNASDNTWGKLTYTFSDAPKVFANISKIVISNQNQNQKWVNGFRDCVGICVFDDNGTLSDQSDDKSVFMSNFIFPETDANGNTTYTKVTPSSVFCMAQDNNGVMWIGTDVGPFLFQNLNKVYNTDYTCSRVKIPRNDSTNLADYLLVNEKIKAIAIDGANRKWLGTESSGVYLMSENGQETIKHFTSSNSPLLSDNILSIAIHPITGEVYFGTSKGIISYQSDAASATDEFNNVYAYPNPVRHDFTGVITITGLVTNTQVKITDLNGNLVCQTVSNGSIATWDGKDVHGRKVNTGVYLAMCVNPDGTKSAITKILVVN